ncbi:hypothetical protein DY000_02033068 [Brassica cretica]|uniref:DUF4283 domain-containing protein n=1 Tax=Brassica cretica TaxID=69181 RepID=A0ABQ7DM19_BRACR|nr:hypothetical protein DY000_02033068 [Brassica cretica]
MHDSTGLACTSRACKGCNGLSGGSPCRIVPSLLVGGTFSMFVLVPGDNLVDSWYRSRSVGLVYCNLLPEVSHNQCWDNLALCSHGIWRILGMLSQNLKVERYILLKPIGDLLVYPFDSKSSLSGRLLLIPRWILGSNGTVILLQNPEMLLGPEGHFWSPEASLDPEVAFRTRRLSKDPEVVWEPGGPGGRLGSRRSSGNPEVLDPEVVFRTRRSFRDPEVVCEPGEPGGLPFPGPEEICSGPGDCLGTRRKPLSDLEGAGMGETQVPDFVAFHKQGSEPELRSRSRSRNFFMRVSGDQGPARKQE